MLIERNIVRKDEIKSEIVSLYDKYFGIPDEIVLKIFEDTIEPLLDRLEDDLSICTEAPYIDKLYRNSYYFYFSGKLKQYNRNTIRLSFFKGELSGSDFRDEARISDLQKKYLGFVVLRPTDPFVIGRNIIDTRGLKDQDILCCSVPISTSVNNIKFTVEGFPHTSQDTETITCAETTLWSIMEYFGHKYEEYASVLPSKIIQTLNELSAERLIPSQGLNILQMSYALKKFGFGTRIYSKNVFQDNFFWILRTYIESGLPIILAIQNDHMKHAVLCIGHETLKEEHINSLEPDRRLTNNILEKTMQKKITLYDYNDIKRKFIFMDDNRPAYQKNFLDKPISDSGNSQIFHFIVPLYSKIHLGAESARVFLHHLIFDDFFEELREGEELVFRLLLASSRSFKHSVALNNSVATEIKEVLMEIALPKFIWVGEITTRQSLKEDVKMATGLAILDATESNLKNRKPLVYVSFRGKVIYRDPDSNEYLPDDENVSLQPFSIYMKNLNGL